MESRSRPCDEGAPWFRCYPRGTVAVALVLYVAVFGFEVAFGGASDAVTILCVLPTALLAVAFGTRIGVLAGAFSVVVLVTAATVDGQSLTVLGWFARATAMLLLGTLLGAAVDSLQAAADAEKAVVAARLREREAAEINDSILQGLAAAKWSFEAGNRDGGLRLLTETMDTASTLVQALLRGQPLMTGDDDGVEDASVSPVASSSSLARAVGTLHHVS